MYNTRQGNMILSFFKENPHSCYCAKDIIENSKIRVGEATVYRVLSRLTSSGDIKRFMGENGAMYQYNSCADCHTHFHLKCTGCGNLIHMDCDLFGDMVKHIRADHNFDLDASKTTLYGICEGCKKGANK